MNNELICFRSTKATPPNKVKRDALLIREDLKLDYLTKITEELWQEFLGINKSILIQEGSARDFMGNLHKFFEKIIYVNSGVFSEWAHKRAKQNSEFVTETPDYLEETTAIHFCSNNSAKGDTTPIPKYNKLIADATSLLGAVDIQIEKIDLIYASLQKLIGFLPNARVIIHSANIEIKKVINTEIAPQIASALATVKYLINEFSTIEELGAYNKEKSDLLYYFLDRSDLFEPLVKENRSITTITFALKNKKLTDSFLNFMKDRKGITDLAGYKNKDFRVGLFNFITQENVEYLVKSMFAFEQLVKQNSKTI